MKKAIEENKPKRLRESLALLVVIVVSPFDITVFLRFILRRQGDNNAILSQKSCEDDPAWGLWGRKG